MPARGRTGGGVRRGGGLSFERETMEAIDRVYRFALHLTRDPADAEDLVQETYLRAYRHRHQYQPGTNCTAWLFTICRHLWVQQRRRGDRVTAYDIPELDALAGRYLEDRPSEGAGVLLDLPEFGDVLRKALEEIPEVYRLPIVLVDIEDQSYAAAAQILGVPVGTVRSRLFRGRRMLQARLLAYAEDAGILRSKGEG